MAETHQPGDSLYMLAKRLESSPPDMQRLRAIYIRDPSPVDVMLRESLDCLTQPATAIYSIYIEAWRYRHPFHPHFLGSSTPNLRELTLKTQFGIVPTHTLLRNLTTLSLTNSSESPSWTIEETLVVLAACPHLTRLGLTNVVESSPVDSIHKVTLPLRLFVFTATKIAAQRLVERLESSCFTVLDGHISTTRQPDFVPGQLSPTCVSDTLTSLFVSLFASGYHAIGYSAKQNPLDDLRASLKEPRRKRDVREFIGDHGSKTPSTDMSPRPFLFDIEYATSFVDDDNDNDFVARSIETVTHSQVNTVRWLFIAIGTSMTSVMTEETWRQLFAITPLVERLSIHAEDGAVSAVLGALSTPMTIPSHEIPSHVATHLLLPRLHALELAAESWRRFNPWQTAHGQNHIGNTSLYEDSHFHQTLSNVLSSREARSTPITSLVLGGHNMPVQRYK